MRFTTKTWNLTTHKIDPDVDDARENVLGDLIGTKHVLHMGYVPGVGRHDAEDPGRNLTGDPSLQAGDAYHVSHYASVNLVYKLLKRLSVGVEGLYGYHTVNDGSDVGLYRIQVGLVYSLFD